MHAEGVELLWPLRTRKLLIPQSNKTRKTCKSVQPRYTPVHGRFTTMQQRPGDEIS